MSSYLYRVIALARGYVVMPEINQGDVVPWNHSFYAETTNDIGVAITQIEALRSLDKPKTTQVPF